MSLHDFFANHPVFNVEELVIQKEDKSHWTRKNLLAHHRKQGRILLIRRGLYAVVPPGSDPNSYPVDPYLIASKSADDAVLAYHTALEVHGKAHSVFERYFFQSSKQLRPSTFRNYRFQCVLFPKVLRTRSNSGSPQRSSKEAALISASPLWRERWWTCLIGQTSAADGKRRGDRSNPLNTSIWI